MLVSVSSTVQLLARNVVSFILVVLSALAAASCTPSTRGTPERLFTVSEEVAFFKAFSGPEAYKAYIDAGSDDDRRRIRDKIAYNRMAAIDLRYSQFEASLTTERQSVGFLTTLAQIGLMSSSTLVAANATKTILSATATAVTGAKEAYDKDILIEKAISFLQDQMRTNRKEVKTKIIQRLNLNDVNVYPLELALSDLEDYFSAGTITGALIGLSKETGIRLEEATLEEAEILEANFQRTVSCDRLKALYFAKKVGAGTITNWIKANTDSSLSFLTFMNSGNGTACSKMLTEFGLS